MARMKTHCAGLEPSRLIISSVNFSAEDQRTWIASVNADASKTPASSAFQNLDPVSCSAASIALEKSDLNAPSASYWRFQSGRFAAGGCGVCACIRAQRSDRPAHLHSGRLAKRGHEILSGKIGGDLTGAGKTRPSKSANGSRTNRFATSPCETGFSKTSRGRSPGMIARTSPGHRVEDWLWHKADLMRLVNSVGFDLQCD